MVENCGHHNVSRRALWEPYRGLRADPQGVSQGTEANPNARDTMLHVDLAALALQPKEMPPLEVELPAVNDPNKADSEVRLSWGMGTRHDRPTLMRATQSDTPRRRPAVHRAVV